MGIFDFNRYKLPKKKWEDMTDDEIDNEFKNSVINILRMKPYLIEDIMIEVRKIKIDKIISKNEVRTVSKRKRRTNIPSSDTSV